MNSNSIQKLFFTLLRAGLWERDAQLSQFTKIDYSQLYQIAEEQSVVGIVAAGLDHVTDIKVPQDELLQFVGGALQLEQQNKAMNMFVSNLIEKLRMHDIYTLLLKGQGIAQCYQRPLWRASGDVDLYLYDDNYSKAEKLLSPLATHIDDEIDYAKHKAFTIDDWTVELHGSLRSGLWRKLDCVLDEIQYGIFCCGKVRTWVNGETQVFLPRADEDVIYVFSHILQHFYKEGVGLRQICDWCRLLWTYRESLNYRLMESRIKKAGMMSEWKAFSALAVDYIGMPPEVLPFYSNEHRWSRKASRIISFIMDTGNFGHNRDYSYQKKYTYLIMKAISLWKHCIDFERYLVIFPLDAIKVTYRRILRGCIVVLREKGNL